MLRQQQPIHHGMPVAFSVDVAIEQGRQKHAYRQLQQLFELELTLDQRLTLYSLPPGVPPA